MAHHIHLVSRSFVAMLLIPDNPTNVTSESHPQQWHNATTFGRFLGWPQTFLPNPLIGCRFRCPRSINKGMVLYLF
jgi:hypothetical protein